jgi:hypothetical protein
MASKSSIAAGRGHVTLGTQDGPFQKGLANAKKDFQAWGKGIAAIGISVAAAGAAVTAPFLAGLAVFTTWGSEMRSGMRQTGIGFDQLTYLSQGLNTSVEDLVPAVAKMSSVLMEAAGGSETANHTLRELGLTMADLNGLSSGDRLQRVAEALGGIADQNQRIALQRQILGRSFQGNTTGGAAGIAARAARRQHIEGAPTEADQQLAAATGRAYKEMGLAITAVWREIGAAAAPVMLEFYRIVTEVVIGIRQFITANRETLTIVFRVADIMVTVGTIIGVLGSVVYGASFAFSFLAGALAIIGTTFSTLWGLTFGLSISLGVLKTATVAHAAATSAATLAAYVWQAAV